jgi:urea transport system substrate-binding protein
MCRPPRPAAETDRFFQEARRVARLRHVGIVTVHDVGVQDNQVYIVSAFIQGTSLSEWLKQRRPTWQEATRIAAEIADALAHAHAQLTVHRDIKPANILMTEENNPVLVDFGLGLDESEQAGRDLGIISGTPAYMSPEQVSGEAHRIDGRTDIYSLGCTLYYLLAGQSPFPSSKYSTTMQQMWAHSQDPRPPIRELRPDVPEAVAAVVDRMLAKSADERFGSPSEVADALRPFVEDCNLAEFVRTARRTTTSRIDLSRVSSTSPSKEKAVAAPPLGVSRRTLIAGAGALAAVLLIAVGAFMFRGGRDGRDARPDDGKSEGASGSAVAKPAPPSGTPIKVGVLHSRTGTMAISERSVIDATLLAIEEINSKGGVLGRPVQAVIEDGESDPRTFAARAEKLITEDKVCTVFGCWTSASRKTVLPVFEKHNHLLFYPVQYEGLEQSPNIVYTGAVPNQQIIPAIKWCVSFLKKNKFFLVGSDYVFPRTANAIIRDQAKLLGDDIVGEEYLLLGSSDVADVVSKIVAAEPDVILNTINGDSNVAFFRALRAAGVTPDKTPTISFSISEEELSRLSTKDLVGDYAAWSYFQTVDRSLNHEFVRRFQARYGTQRVISDPMEAAYFGVHLWAQAVKEAESDDVAEIRQAVRRVWCEPIRTRSTRPRSFASAKSRRRAASKKFTAPKARSRQSRIPTPAARAIGIRSYSI